MPSIAQETQKLSPSAILSLFTLDVTSLGGAQLRFVQDSQSNNAIVFQGLTYEPVDIEFSGLETTGLGAHPTPSVKLANTSGILQTLINTYGDLNGCELSRIRTFGRFLDGESDADPNAFRGPDRYRVERLVSDNPDYIEWELSSAIDQQGKMIPGRVIIKNTCLSRYRSWNETLNGGAGGFDYSKAICPYAGAQSYDINNQPVANGGDDHPSRTIECCRVRFGADQPLPFGGFLGVPTS